MKPKINLDIYALFVSDLDYLQVYILCLLSKKSNLQKKLYCLIRFIKSNYKTEDLILLLHILKKILLLRMNNKTSNQAPKKNKKVHLHGLKK